MPKGTANMSYDYLIVDDHDLHLFVDFQFRQVLHVRFKECDLASFPTRAELREAMVAMGAKAPY